MIRLDVLLVERELFKTREQAKKAILDARVYSVGKCLTKPGLKVEHSIQLEITGEDMPYVSRGGLKLEKALELFEIDLTNQVVLDIGASTGGFTDCALQHGAILSYALDVGKGQLDISLKQDPRVIEMEKTNFRYSSPSDFKQGKPTFATIDVSFISLSYILPPLASILSADGEVVALIKPQFEAGKSNVKKGIVKDPKIHDEVIQKVIGMASIEGFYVKHLTYSPIKGGDGNIEFLIHLSKVPESMSVDIKKIIAEAHRL